jgi:hypothetical protein
VTLTAEQQAALDRLAAQNGHAASEDDFEHSLGAIPDYPVHVLPSAAAELVRHGAETGLPTSLVAGSALASVASAIGSEAQIEIMPTWHERAILWVAGRDGCRPSRRRGDVMAGRVTGSLIVVSRKSGPVYFLKARDRDGRQVKRKLGPVSDWPQKRAQDALRDFLTDLGRVPDRGDSSVTYAYAAAAWLEYVEHDRRRAPSTVRDYRNTVNRHLVKLLGDRPLSEITVDDVEQLRGGMLAEISPRTVQKTMVLLHGIYRFAGRRGWTQTNPAAEAERVTVKRRAEFAVLSPDEVQAVARATTTEQAGALILVAAFTGLRLGELRALRWRDVDFANRLVHVRRSHYGAAGAAEGPPKSGQARSVPLIDLAARALDGLSRRDRPTGGPPCRVCRRPPRSR